MGKEQKTKQKEPETRPVRVFTHGAIIDGTKRSEGDIVRMTEEDITAHRNAGIALGNATEDEYAKSQAKSEDVQEEKA